jgi:hypothetical protein
MRSGPFTGGAVLLPWDQIDLRTRRRLIDARPIVAERRRAQTFAMFAVACACGFALVLASGSGFGRVDEASLVQHPWNAVVYAVLLAGIVVPSAWLARRVLSAGAWFPYGRALLRLDALEHTPKGLVVRPFGDARHAIIEHGFVELQYADGSTFRVRTNVAPDVMDAALGVAEDVLARASLSADHTERDTVDPLTSLRDDRGFSPRAGTRKLGSNERAARDRTPLYGAVLALASFAAAWPLLGLRNRTSDDAAFAYARHENDRIDYEAYLVHGVRHVHEVNEDLLPRLVLDDAEKSDGVEDLAKFLERFPRSRFDDEARARLASTCVRLGDGYTLASKLDVFADLDRFVRQYPACTLHRADVSARFFDARRKALRESTDLHPALRDGFIALLDRAERKQARVPFRVVLRAGTLDATIQSKVEARLAELAGPVIDSDVTHDGDGEWLEIGIAELCGKGHHLRRAVIASFELWLDGARQAQWGRPTFEEDLATAVTTSAPSGPALPSLCYVRPDCVIPVNDVPPSTR